MESKPDISRQLYQALGFALSEEQQRYTEDELLDWLADRIGVLLQNKRDWMLSKLYRLDIREHDIKAAIADDRTDTARALAGLILERQKQKAEAQQYYGPQKFELGEEDDPSLEELRW